MKYNDFKGMMKFVRSEIKTLRKRGQTIADIAFNITEDITYDYFWDIHNDKPMVDVEYLEIAIKNFVRNEVLRVCA